MLDRLPPELLQDVYHYSGNAVLIYACRSTFHALNDAHSRLLFCSNLLYQRAFTRKGNQAIAKSVNHCLAQEWLNHSLICKIQTLSCPDCEDGVNTLPEFVPGVHLPARVLEGPWTDSKVVILEDLRNWNLYPRVGKIWHPGLWRALIAKDLPIIEHFLLGDDAMRCVVRVEDVMKVAEMNCRVYLLKAAVGLYFGNANGGAFDQAWLGLCSAIMNELAARMHKLRQKSLSEQSTPNNARFQTMGDGPSRYDRKWDSFLAQYRESDGVKVQKPLVKTAARSVVYASTYEDIRPYTLGFDRKPAGWADLTGYWGVLDILGSYNKNNVFVWGLR